MSLFVWKTTGGLEAEEVLALSNKKSFPAHFSRSRSRSLLYGTKRGVVKLDTAMKDVLCCSSWGCCAGLRKIVLDWAELADCEDIARPARSSVTDSKFLELRYLDEPPTSFDPIDATAVDLGDFEDFEDFEDASEDAEEGWADERVTLVCAPDDNIVDIVDFVGKTMRAIMEGGLLLLLSGSAGMDASGESAYEL